MPRQFSRPAVIGATGQLGHDLLAAFAGEGPVGLGHADVSIEDRASVEAALDRANPDLVLNTAAFHNVPLCETHQSQALGVNAVGVMNLALACERRGIPLLTVSTDYVFDGEKGAPYAETDEPHPLSVYGNSKLAGELLAAAACSKAFVVRTSGLFGAIGSKTKGYTFIDRILKQARAGEEIKVVTDMTFSPSYTAHVASAIRTIVQNGSYGTYHVSNSGACTWYEFALEALRQAGLDAAVTPIRSSEWRSDVRRPANSSLAHERLKREGLPPMPPWQDGIAAYLKVARP